VTAACLTLYFSLAAIIAIGFYALIRLTGRQRAIALGAIASGGAIFLALWGHGLWLQRDNFNDPASFWYKDLAADHVPATLARFARLPIRFLAEPLNDEPTQAAATGALVLYVLPWLLAYRRRELILPALWLLLCAGIITAMDLPSGMNHLFWIKYTLLGAPAVYLLLPMLGKWVWLTRGIAGAATLYCVLSVLTADTIPMVDYHRIAAALDRYALPTDGPMIFDAGSHTVPFTGELYMGVQRYAKRLPSSVVLLKWPPPPELLNELARRAAGGHCWMICWLDGSPQADLSGWRMTKAIYFPSQVSICQMAPP
jgi:hypothetical protein